VLAIWLLALVLSAAFIVELGIDNATQAFHDKVESLYRVVNHQVNVNETIIDGFAATVDAMGKLDRVKIRDYVRRIRKRYPDIFMFEIAEKVPRQDKDRFVQDMRATVYDKFSIRRFSYGADRKWYATGDKAFYLPIIFMQPFPPESRQVLGLDLTTNNIFVESLQESARLHVPVATRPFQLVEGNQAYVIHRPINDQVTTDKDGYAQRYVMLVLLGKALFMDSLPAMKGYGVTLYHSGFNKKGADGKLYSQALPAHGSLQTLLFPKISLTLPLESKTQPFVLHVEEQLGWDVINWHLLLFLLTIGLVTYYVVIRYARAYHESQIQRVQEANRLFYMANHDALTGLANRNLLLDRLEHALKQARRLKSKLAVLFLDIDDFKQINDKHGHDTGDGVLIAVADRLRHCVRSGDTLSRRSGDEFVIILENIIGHEIAEQVISKIEDSFREPVVIGQLTIELRVSIGLAIYPEEGEDPRELLELADKRMYANK